MIHHEDPWLTVYGGDARDVLPTLPDASVHCVVTSPPYWGLRDYGSDGQLGLEATPEEYVANLVAVFREVRRVLRDDGTLWLNLGDSYAGGVMAPPGTDKQASNRGATNGVGIDKSGHGLKPKDLVGIPWRVAFALQGDGWVLRSEIIWAKPNPMPESVTDRPTKSHEQLFLLSKARRIGPAPSRYDDIPEGEARWLAALFDGEGSLICRREADKGDDYGAHAAQVSIGSTSRALLDRLARVIGEGNVLEREGQNVPMFYWQTSGKRALGLLRRLYPFLIVKQRQARCLIALEERKQIRGGHVRLDPKEIAYRDTIWATVKELNHFGDPDLSAIPVPTFGRWTEQAYYFDQEAVREPVTNSTIKRLTQAGLANQRGSDRVPGKTNGNMKAVGHAYKHEGLWADDEAMERMRGGRNLRSVWTIATRPYPGAHFAVFPPELPERCIKAGCPENGVVLDPFAGSGTVGMVANRLSRRAILIDLNPEYLAQQMKRNAQVPLGV